MLKDVEISTQEDGNLVSSDLTQVQARWFVRRGAGVAVCARVVYRKAPADVLA